MLNPATLVAALLAPCTQEESQGILAPARIAPTAAIVPLRPVTADLDGDGDLDLAIGNGFLQLQPPLVELQYLDADGNLERSANLSSPAANPFAMPRYVAAHDFDGDRLPELVVAYSDGLVELFPNVGGSFAPPLRFSPGFVGSAPTAVSYNTLCHAITDLDSDGREELVLPFSEQQLFFPRRGVGLVILEHDGGSGILLGHSGALGSPQAALVAGDFDGDGRGDLAGIDGAQDLHLARGDGNGGFAIVVRVPLDTRGVRADELAAGDLDLDGDLDLVIGYGGSPHVELLENLGGGNFRSQLLAFDSDPRVGVRGVALRDLDGDGAPELLLLEAGHPGERGRLGVWRWRSRVFELDARLDAGVVPAGTDIGPDLLTTGDLDGNATPDIALAGYRAQTGGAPQIGIFANRATPPYSVAVSGLAFAGSNGNVPRIACGGGPGVLGNAAFWIEVSGGLPAARAALLLGNEPTVSYAAGGVELLLVPLQLDVVHLDHSGRHRWSMPIGSDPSMVGEWGFAQVWIADPWAPNAALVATSQRLGVRIGERW
ncbi:MAG: VCBS repeat-containing protein [Planctomycetes bacterium]|nr:VCBS repeat-containing protein [Planctomycetota bacterium]